LFVWRISGQFDFLLRRRESVVHSLRCSAEKAQQRPDIALFFLDVMIDQIFSTLVAASNSGLLAVNGRRSWRILCARHPRRIFPHHFRQFPQQFGKDGVTAGQPFWRTS
jgi:hypothetical protein